MENKRRKTHREPYKQYLQNTDLPIPRQTRSRWKTEFWKTHSRDCEDLSEDLGEPISHCMNFSEFAGDPDEDGNDGIWLDDDRNLSYVSEDNTDEEDVFYDANLPDPPEPDDNFIYDGASITKLQSSSLIMAFIIRHNLTGHAVRDLLTLINQHLPLPSIPPSNYLLRKYCMPHREEDNIVYHACCANCSNYLGVDQELHCENCDIDISKYELIKGGHFFIALSVGSQLQNLLQRESVFRLIKDTTGSNEGTLFQDICDGMMYKSIMKEAGISLTFNCDGISPFQSSTGCVWPILCTINELPPKERKKHVMLAGIWFGSGKPNMQNFLKGFVEECESLQNDGLVWKNPVTGQNVNTKVYAVACACDSVARCQLQGIVQFNGYFGCSWCLNPGERYEGTRHVYRCSDPPHELRTHKNFVESVVLARQTRQSQRGVKSDPSPLLLLPSFNMVKGFPVDYMHSVCEGVVDRITSLWFDSSNHQEPWYIGRSLPQIDGRLKKITPPTEITRLPASPSKRAFWKASEFKNWLLFYLLPVLNGILPAVYLNHIVLLIQSVWLLTKETVTSADIEVSRTLLKSFVCKMETLYGIQHMTYNNHLLLHLPETVLNWGPLWASSCFLFEGYNRKLKSLFHGTRGVAHQIVNNYLIAQDLSKKVNVMPDETPEDYLAFFKSLIRGYPLQLSISKTNDGNTDILLQGKGKHFTVEAPDMEQCLANYFGEPGLNLEVTEYSKLIVDGVKYEKERGHRNCSRSDSIVAFGPKQIGKITHILRVRRNHDTNVVFVIQPFMVESNIIATDQVTGAKADHILLVSEEPLLPPLVMSASYGFLKCVTVSLEDVRYCCILPNMIELD